ncbi:hypothetical protein QWZ13_14785 [Reinekea marina]|nr:hypothetical protein [Reinekea marina]MDN3650182.1 hypothetical protein [Reinekea marina]
MPYILKLHYHRKRSLGKTLLPINFGIKVNALHKTANIESECRVIKTKV